ncbi:sigma factor-like helix-turn-helix DNA-binding protein [Phyllobacterium phragmitis]|uniref:sigma factor-like helix-turn-helix DNA-binding protein n=1 Tax=Phyllobacterium phragmitis TaxID=2670329 RepID=UPI00315B07F6
MLARIVTRLCLDHIKSARVHREIYPGTWLPEPVEDEDDDLTLTLMMVLERLSPLERTAFLLHDVFDVNFEEVARIPDRDPASCRQLASRARSCA